MSDRTKTDVESSTGMEEPKLNPTGWFFVPDEGGLALRGLVRC
ncbi:MAG: hypothetical protein QNJ71_05330 [Acidimicrobiia bacterium]|nr:hypothetical protein [Acidimicrobiia bacterium]